MSKKGDKKRGKGRHSGEKEIEPVKKLDFPVITSRNKF